MKIVLVGGYPKGFDIPFHPKTASGRILRKIVSDLEIDAIYFDLWENKPEEDARKLKTNIKKELLSFESEGHVLIALGRYIEKVLADNDIKSHYLPHPASRDKKYIDILRGGLRKKKSF